jgi:hypothetical protein
MEAGVGGSGRELLALGYRMALSIWLKYTGMRHLESEARNSRSNGSFEVSYGKSAI